MKETLFLKLTLIFIGIMVLALCIFLVPKIGNFAAELYPDLSYLKPLILIDMYAAAIPFYIALYQSFNLLSYIDKKQAFSELSVKALKNIKFCAITISTLYLLGMPLYYLMSKKLTLQVLCQSTWLLYSPLWWSLFLLLFFKNFYKMLLI